MMQKRPKDHDLRQHIDHWRQQAGLSTMQAPAQQYVAPPQAQPGILYTLGAVASFGLVGFVCYLTITQYLELFQIK